jgi:hypothetical protein
LAEALERRPARLADVRLATFFHELYATGKPWQRAFWTSSRQRAAAIRVARASDALMTNREQSARWLEWHAGLPAGSVPHFPVCSNVGEPAELTPWGERANRAVTFGGARFKAPFLTGAGVEKTVTLCHRLGLDELVDLGEHCRCHEERFTSAGIAYRRLGYLPAADVMGYLSDARIALIDYFPGYLAKSGVLAAAAAAGAAPVMWSRSVDSDGLEFGRNLLTIDAVVESDAAADFELSKVSAAIADRYRQHSSDRHAELHLRSCGATMPGMCVRQ